MADSIKESFTQVENMMHTMRQVNQMSMDFMNKMITDGLKFWQKQPCPCESEKTEPPRRVPNDARVICPPQDNCPPRCLLTITRHGNIGETIMVPFKVRNLSNYVKTYRLGVRWLTDEHGQNVIQPTLDKLEIEVQPGMAVMAEMMVNISENLERGAVYETEIVIRERRHNQNICFKLYVNPVSEVPEAAPYDEREIDTHFHRWYYHYYCTPPYERDMNISELKDELVAKPAERLEKEEIKVTEVQAEDVKKYSVGEAAKAISGSRKKSQITNKKKG
jgi:hypothetical protein